MLELPTRLPEWRSRIARDLAGRGSTRDRVLALALQLMDRGYFRAGGEQSAEDFDHYGLATLLCEHFTVKKNAVEFDYPAKSGVQRTIEIDDPEVVRAARSLMRRTERTERLLVCRSGNSGWVDVEADDLNARFTEVVGAEFTVKDRRTWHARCWPPRSLPRSRPPRRP